MSTRARQAPVWSQSEAELLYLLPRDAPEESLTFMEVSVDPKSDKSGPRKRALTTANTLL